VSVLRRTSRVALLAPSLVLSYPCLAVAESLCETMLPAITAPGLYAARSDCNNPSCLQKVITLPSGESYLSTLSYTGQSPLTKPYDYAFLFKTSQSKVSNSIVVVQQKLVSANFYGDGHRKRIASVVLSRDRTDFACYPNQASSYPVSTDPSGLVPVRQVAFENFDYYHRYGQAFNDDAKLLVREFHIKYQNDPAQACSWRHGVWTNDSARRPLFLLNDRANFPSSFLGELYGRLLQPAVAGAIGSAFGAESSDTADLHRFVQFKVHMTNYRKAPGESGCFSFLVSTHTGGRPQQQLPLKEVDIALRDLEELQTTSVPQRYEPQIWQFQIE
jgi:hypothetical protein